MQPPRVQARYPRQQGPGGKWGPPLSAGEKRREGQQEAGLGQGTDDAQPTMAGVPNLALGSERELEGQEGASMDKQAGRRQFQQTRWGCPRGGAGAQVGCRGTALRASPWGISLNPGAPQPPMRCLLPGPRALFSQAPGGGAAQAPLTAPGDGTVRMPYGSPGVCPSSRQVVGLWLGSPCEGG